jgi:hypothetical protein
MLPLDRPCPRLLSVLLLAGLVLAPTTARAGILDRLVRKAGKVADDVPINRLDDVAEDLAATRLPRSRSVPGTAQIDDAVERTRAARRTLKESIGEGADPTLLRQIDALDAPRLEAAAILAQGSRTVREAVPDLALRSRFLRNGGAETVATLGRYPDLATDAIRFDAALQAGRLLPPPGGAAPTVQSFGHFFHTQGDRAHQFWSRFVRPHWKLWLDSGALAAVLAAPDDYLDPIGNLTQKGIEKVGALGGDLLGKALGGAASAVITATGTATKVVIQETATSFQQTFLRDLWGVLALLAILVTGGILLLPYARRKLGILRRTHKKPTPGSLE